MATAVLGQIYLSGKIVTAGALHTMKASAGFIRERRGVRAAGEGEPQGPVRCAGCAALASGPGRGNRHPVVRKRSIDSTADDWLLPLPPQRLAPPAVQCRLPGRSAWRVRLRISQQACSRPTSTATRSLNRLIAGLSSLPQPLDPVRPGNWGLPSLREPVPLGAVYPRRSLR